MNVKLYQICYKQEQIEQIGPPFEVWDNLKNNTPELCEFPIFNEIYDFVFTEGTNIDYFGALSPKFEKKAGISGQKFLDWIDETLKIQTPNVLFINPTPINESLFPSTIYQGNNCHPHLMNFMQKILFRLNYSIVLRDGWMDTNYFSLCNYFVGDKKFWINYLRFVNSFIGEVKNNEEDYKLMFETGANYGPNSSLPYYTFVVERLFSLFIFIHNNDIKSIHYKYSKEELMAKSDLSSTIIDELQMLSYLKASGINYNDFGLMGYWGKLRNRFAQANPYIFNVE